MRRKQRWRPLLWPTPMDAPRQLVSTPAAVTPRRPNGPPPLTGALRACWPLLVLASAGQLG
jgi:hypothetical protein